MVVIEIQDAITTGQLRPTDQLIDVQDRVRPGTVLAVLEPVFEGHADAVPRGSTCVGVAYSSHAAQIEAAKMKGYQCPRDEARRRYGDRKCDREPGTSAPAANKRNRVSLMKR